MTQSSPKPISSTASDRALPAGAGRLMRAATYASVGVAVVLIIAKFWAYLVTDSVSMLSTLIDSILDALASLVSLVAVHHALQPADREHRFGHGKAEPLAGLAQAAFISGSAVFLLMEAVRRIIHPRAIEQSDAGIAVMIISIVLTLGLVGFQRMVIRKTGSIAIGADSLHYQADLLVNISVVAVLYIVSRFNLPLLDPLLAVAIAIYIVHGAWRIALTALDVLMDRELPDADRQKIRTIALAHPEVTRVHDLRTRTSGQLIFIQFDMEMDGSLTLKRAHDVSLKVMRQIEEVFPNAEIFIHQDPEGVEEHHHPRFT